MDFSRSFSPTNAIKTTAVIREMMVPPAIRRSTSAPENEKMLSMSSLHEIVTAPDQRPSACG